VSLGSPVTSGIDLTGTWKLDMTRSEPLDPYLRAMGLADMAVAGNRAQWRGNAGSSPLDGASLSQDGRVIAEK
jgi:hypothetical protein